MNNTNSPNIINNFQLLNVPYVNKSVGLSYFFLIFFGWLGLHRFYIGKFFSGLILLSLNIISALFCISGAFLLGFFKDFYYLGASFIIISIICTSINFIWVIFDFFTFFIEVEKKNIKNQDILLQNFKNRIEKN